MKIKLRGDYHTQRVWLDDKELDPDEGLKIANHSPDGFAWGYGGSGPSQLALSIMLEIFGLPCQYQKFKFDFIAGLPQKDFDTEIEFDELKYGMF